MAKKKKPDHLDALIEELTKTATAEEILGDSGLLKELKKRLIETALAAEMTECNAPISTSLFPLFSPTIPPP